MDKRVLLVKVLLFAILALALVGCGGNDETPPAGNTSQTKALVPDSIVHNEDSEVIEPDAVAPVSAVDVPTEPIQQAVEAEVEAVAVPEAVVAPEVPEKIKSEPVAVAGTGIFSLQLGSYTVLTYAEEKAAQLRDLGYPGTVEQADVGGQLYHRVFIRGLSDRESAEKLGEELHSSLGLSYLIRRK